jgi:hypothetical protein
MAQLQVLGVRSPVYYGFTCLLQALYLDSFYKESVPHRHLQYPSSYSSFLALVPLEITLSYPQIIENSLQKQRVSQNTARNRSCDIFF